MDSVTGSSTSEDGTGEHKDDYVRTKLNRTAKGWAYEQTLITHRLPGEAGQQWLARHALALRQARSIGENERDDRDRADDQRNRG